MKKSAASPFSPPSEVLADFLTAKSPRKTREEGALVFLKSETLALLAAWRWENSSLGELISNQNREADQWAGVLVSCRTNDFFQRQVAKGDKGRRGFWFFLSLKPWRSWRLGGGKILLWVS